MTDSSSNEKRGWFQLLKAGLSRSSTKLSESITGIFTKRKLDRALLDELEEALIAADLGAATAAKLTAALAKDRCDKEVTSEVADKSSAQAVKQVVEILKAQGRIETEFQHVVHRPWGSYEGLAQGPRYQVKRILIKPGASLSLQLHNHRAEHWVVVKGTALVTKGDETLLITENESTYIPLGIVHCLENPGVIPLEIVEVQSGSYLGEDDIVRIGDQYGRV